MDLENVGGSVPFPSAGGFVCGPDSEPSWQRYVFELWYAYYRAVGGSRGDPSGLACGGGAVVEGAGAFARSVAAEDERGCGGLRDSGAISEVCGGDGEGAATGRVADGHGGGPCDGGVGTGSVLRGSGGASWRLAGSLGQDALGCSGRSVATGLTPGSNPRGPNFERNQANRMRKKAAKIAKDVEEKQKRGFFSECDEETQKELRESRAKLLVLENRRRILQENMKINRLESPMAYVEEALRLQRIAEDCEDKKDRVSSWAKTVSTGCASSVARSTPSCVPSLDSVGSAASANALSFAKLPKTAAEEYALRRKWLTEDRLKEARKRCGRALDVNDFVHPKAPFTLDQNDRLDLSQVACGLLPVYFT